MYYTELQTEAKNRLLEILQSEKRTTITTVQQDYIRAEVSSAIFHFVDDIEFYFTVDPLSEKALIHIRSASRIGYSDFGVNRKRVERIRGKFIHADE